MFQLVSITAGFAIDLLIGDPKWFPHPVKLIGKLIEKLEGLLEDQGNKRTAGVVLLVTVISVSFILTYLLAELNIVLEVLLIYMVFAATRITAK